jgi:hypothetical protein
MMQLGSLRAGSRLAPLHKKRRAGGVRQEQQLRSSTAARLDRLLVSRFSVHGIDTMILQHSFNSTLPS